MIVILKNDNNNIFLKAQLKICNLKYIEILSFDKLINLDIAEEFIYIINKDFGLMKKFYFDFEEIDSIKKNLILGHENINTTGQDRLFSEYSKYQDNENLNFKSINFCKIQKNKFVDSLKDKSYEDINQLLINTNFESKNNL